MSVIAKDGRLWAATPTGLACYDGVITRIYGRNHGLTNHGLRTLAIHPETGHLWIGTDIGLQAFDISDGTPHALWSQSLGTVNAMGLSKTTNVIGCSHGLFSGTGSQNFTQMIGSAAANDTIEKILLGAEGSFWIIGSATGLTRISETSDRLSISQSLQNIGKPRALTNGPDGSVFIGGDNGLCQMSGNGAVIATKFLSSPTTALFWDRREIWLANGQTVVSFSDDLKREDKPKTHIRDISVKHIINDRFDNIWLATSGQALLKISHFRQTFVEDFPTTAGHILSIYPDKDGRLIGGSKGLVLPSGQVILDDFEIWDVLRDDEGKIWSATDKGLFCTPNPHLSFSYRHDDCPVIQAPCRAFAMYKDHLYIASIRGLARKELAGVQEILDSEKRALGYVYSLHAGPDGYLWIATLGKGILRYDSDRLEPIALAGMAENSNVYAMTHDKDGRLYFAHDNKITRRDPNGEFRTLYEVDASVAAWSLGWMRGGLLVAGSASGLIVFDDETGQVKHKVSGNFEDVPWEFTTSRSLAIIDNRTLYCGLGSGLRTVEIDELTSKNEAPVARLANLNWRNTDPVEAEDKIVVTKGRWHLTVEISTEWFLDQCQMRYKLKGFDEDWSHYRNLGPIHFTSLPIGSYKLALQLRSNLAGAGPVSQILNLDVVAEI